MRDVFSFSFLITKRPSVAGWLSRGSHIEEKYQRAGRASFSNDVSTSLVREIRSDNKSFDRRIKPASDTHISKRLRNCTLSSMTVNPSIECSTSSSCLRSRHMKCGLLDFVRNPSYHYPRSENASHWQSVSETFHYLFDRRRSVRHHHMFPYHKSTSWSLAKQDSR